MRTVLAQTIFLIFKKIFWKATDWKINDDKWKVKTVYLFCLVTGSKNSRHSSSNSQNKISRQISFIIVCLSVRLLEMGTLPQKLAQVSCCPVNRIIGSRTALLVEHPTEKPGAILTRVRVPGVARDFTPRVNFQRRLLGCLYSPPWAVACINITNVTSYKSQALAAILLFTYTKMLHILIGMGSAAPAAAVPYPGKMTRISGKRQKICLFFIYYFRRKKTCPFNSDSR